MVESGSRFQTCRKTKWVVGVAKPGDVDRQVSGQRLFRIFILLTLLIFHIYLSLGKFPLCKSTVIFSSLFKHQKSLFRCYHRVSLLNSGCFFSFNKPKHDKKIRMPFHYGCLSLSQCFSLFCVDLVTNR